MTDAEYLKKYGPWAVVTGASDGIGRAMATSLGKKGFHLVLVARNQSALDSVASEIRRDFNVDVKALSADLSVKGSIQILLETVSGLNVGLFAAVAGFGTSGPLIRSNIEAELNMIDLNCRAVVEQCFHFGQMFSLQKRGGLVLLSSIVAFQGVPYAANYAATKAFVQSLAEGLHFELAPFGVDVLASAPGPVNSGFAGRAHMKMGQAASPEDVAESTLAALGRTVTVRPGLISKMLGWSLQVMPRRNRVRVMQKIMSKIAAGS